MYPSFYHYHGDQLALLVSCFDLGKMANFVLLLTNFVSLDPSLKYLSSITLLLGNYLLSYNLDL